MDGVVCQPSFHQQFAAMSTNGDDIQPILEKPVKNPKIVARKYQTDLCKKALKGNVVVNLATGCGKTHIAVLLIYEMGHLIKKPQKNICIFLAPTVALVQQQAKAIEKSIDFKVGIYCGSSAHLKGQYDWEKEIEEHEVLVMTPQILLHNLSHCYIKIESIALLIFDECHYAQVESHHPYAEIMKILDAEKLPRIFGMTASPELGKGGSVDSLSVLFRAKVCSVDDKDELEQFVTSSKVNVYYYGSTENSRSCPNMLYTKKLEEIKYQCMSALRMNTLDQSIRSTTKKMLHDLHSSLIFFLENLGLWGALQAGNIFLNGDTIDQIEVMGAERSTGDDNICNKYLHAAILILSSDSRGALTKADLSDLREPFISRKLLELIGILSKFRLQENMKCIIFVNRILTARCLSYILQNLEILSSWKCDFLAGVNSRSVSRKNTNIVLEKFRSGELNLLVATKVCEEGLDIDTCCLVIRFDLPETVVTFIQSRGRARMPQTEYAFLVDRGKPRELNLIEHFKRDEAPITRSSFDSNDEESRAGGKFEAKVNEGKVHANGFATSFTENAKANEGKFHANGFATSFTEKAKVLKDQGYKPNSKPWDQVLKESETTEPELIGGGANIFNVNRHPIPKLLMNNGCNANKHGTGAPCMGLAKSRLYEACAANCWKPPVFECFQETGPSHIKKYMFKVVVKIDEMQDEAFEFYGDSRMRKKDAAERAAEGALWYLKHGGYLWNKK